MKHCQKCFENGKPQSLVKSHNTSDCRVFPGEIPSMKRIGNGSYGTAEPPAKKRFVRTCWYCKAQGHFMLSRDQKTVECPLLLAEFASPKCHHPGCQARDHIAQYHSHPQERHRIEGKLVNSCKNVILQNNQAGRDTKSSMVFEVEGLTEEEAREAYENGELLTEE